MPIKSQSVEIGSLVNEIKDKKLLLPELQRRYVWKSTQVRDLFDSLYHQYPSGQLLVWQTEDLEYARAASLEMSQPSGNYVPQPLLLLDGQQRLTSLAAILNDVDLIVRDSKRSIDIVFNIYTEKFEVAGPRQQGEKGWISLRRLFREGIPAIMMDLQLDLRAPETKDIYQRLMRLDNIRTYEYKVSVLEQMSYDEVTHIFVRINSGGTTLGSADLALAQISSRWRGVTEELDTYYKAVKRRTGGELELETGVLLRAMSVMLSGRTRLNELFRGERQNLSAPELKDAWIRVKLGMDQAINFLSSNCRIDRLSLLPTQYILITLTAFFDHFENLSPEQARDLQRWVYMALIWTRYSVSAETAVDQDVAHLNSDDPIARMIQNVEDAVGHNRPVTERELQGQLRNSPYMLMAYVLARRAEAEDWFNGIQIGSGQTLEIHHIFPKDVLRERYDLKKDRPLVDQVANLAFLSQKANAKIRSTPPVDYLPTIPKERLKAQCVPGNPVMWKLDCFEDFLLERRTTLGHAINDLLNSLSREPAIWPIGMVQLLEERIDVIERQMRDLIADRLTEARGQYADALLPADVRKSLQHRVDQHVQKNPADSGKYDSLPERLKLAQFSDYVKIIRANWPMFQTDFRDEQKFAQHYQAVTTARNAFKHNNELSNADRASAEAGLIWLEDCLRALQMAEAEEELEEEVIETDV
jgi:hypothetical protein